MDDFLNNYLESFELDVDHIKNPNSVFHKSNMDDLYTDLYITETGLIVLNANDGREIYECEELIEKLNKQHNKINRLKLENNILLDYIKNKFFE